MPAIEVDGVFLEVDPDAGGRMVSFRNGAFELLSDKSVNGDNYGSTLWASPQSDWDWPPPAEMDRGSYGVEANRDELTLTSRVDKTLGIQVIKRFSADRARGAFTLSYTLINAGASPRVFAPWEVTRVHPRGLTFFPTASPAFGPLRLDERRDATWFSHDPSALPVAGLKAFARGEGGMLAHAAKGHLFLKKFDPVPLSLQAPGEAAVEIYANPRYVELEVQGSRMPLETGASSSWSVVWCLRELPPDIPFGAGSSALLEFAFRALKRLT